MSGFKKVDTISKLLEKTLIDKEVKDAERRTGYFKQYLSPSTDLICARKAYFNIKYSGSRSLPIKREDFSYANSRAKTLGTTIHEQLQSLFQESKILLLNETPLKDENLKFSARLDSVVEIDGELILVEIKSAKSYSIQLMSEEGAPDLAHLLQIQAYFHLLELHKDREDIKKFFNGRKITKGILYYECKNDQKPTEYEVERNEVLIDGIKKHAQSVWKHINEGKIPKLVFLPDDPECLYKCQYYELCHQKPKPEKFIEKGVFGDKDAKRLNNEPKF